MKASNVAKRCNYYIYCTRKNHGRIQNYRAFNIPSVIVSSLFSVVIFIVLVLNFVHVKMYRQASQLGNCKLLYNKEVYNCV